MRRGQKTSPPAAAVNIWIEQFVLQPHSRPVVTDRVTVRGCEHCSGVIGCQEGLVTNSIISLAQSRIVVKTDRELLVCCTCTNIPSRFASLSFTMSLGPCCAMRHSWYCFLLASARKKPVYNRTDQYSSSSPSVRLLFSLPHSHLCCFMLSSTMLCYGCTLRKQQFCKHSKPET